MRRFSPLLLAGALGIAGGIGCATDMPGVKCKVVSEPSDPMVKKGPRTYYTRFQGKGNKEPRFAVFFSRLRLRAPHEGYAALEVDPDRLEESGGARACIEIDDLSDDTSVLERFFFLCGEYRAPSSGSEGVEYLVSWDGVSGLTLFAPDQRHIGLRAVWDGVTLSFYGTVDGASMLVDSGAFVNASETFGSIGMVRFEKKATLRLLDFGLVENGPLAGGASLEDQVVDALGLAGNDLTAAARALNGPTIDWPGGDTSLVDALANFTAAEMLLPGLADESVQRKVGKKIQGGMKQTGKARDQVAKQSQKGAIRKIQKGVKAASEASERVRPFLLVVGP